jgi:hypothetical protein
VARSWICHIQLLMGLAISGPNPAELMTIFYSLRFETPPTWRARSLYLYPPRTRCSVYSPKHWLHFSSSPTARRATVEVFEPTWTEQSNSLLPATTQHDHSWHRAPLGPIAIYLFSVKTLVFFSFFFVPPLIKREGLDFFIIGVSLLHLFLPEVTLK